MNISEGNFDEECLKWDEKEEETDTVNSEPPRFNATYQGFAELLGEKAAFRIWKNYAGLTVTFPKKLYSEEYVRDFIKEHEKSMSTRAIAKELNLTERRIRQIMHDIREAEDQDDGS